MAAPRRRSARLRRLRGPADDDAPKLAGDELRELRERLMHEAGGGEPVVSRMGERCDDEPERVMTVMNSEFARGEPGPPIYYREPYIDPDTTVALGPHYDKWLQGAMMDAYEECRETARTGQRLLDEPELGDAMKHLSPPDNVALYGFTRGIEPEDYDIDNEMSTDVVRYVKAHMSPEGGIEMDALMWDGHLTGDQKRGIKRIPGLKRIALYDLE